MVRKGLQASLMACAPVALAALIAALYCRGHRERVLAGYATDLARRTPNQVFNAGRAAAALDGYEVGPGETFSFNRVVGPWTADRGYRKAAVSYDGELVPADGGGVCQTSTTLYNAALLAGMEVVERHRHFWLPSYVAPGRDAAVAFPSIDLRLRNPHPFALRLRSGVHGRTLSISILARRSLSRRYSIIARVEQSLTPGSVVESGTGDHARVVNAGRQGTRVVVERRCSDGGVEVLSRDYYPPMNRLVRQP